MQTRTLTRYLAFPLLLWGALRVCTSILAALISSLRPLTALEQAVPLWPPSAPAGAWLERALLSPWLRWDAIWFSRIVSEGYRAEDGTANFQPLYPWLAIPLERVGLHPVLALLLVGAAVGIGFLVLYHYLARMDLEQEQAQLSSVLFMLFPAAFVIFAPYSEGLFLLLSVLCLALARNKRWWWAGLAGGLAALTRQQGIFLVAPLAWELWQSSGYRLGPARKDWNKYLSLGLVPAGLAAWTLYRWLVLGDVLLEPGSFQSLIYSLLISPSTHQIVPIQSFVWPWQGIWYALVKVSTHPDLDIWVNLLSAGLFILFLIAAWKHMRPAYRVYALLNTMISFSFYTGPHHPYMGLPRHLLLGFPVFIGLAAALKRPWMRLPTMVVCACGSLLALAAYVLESWVP